MGKPSFAVRLSINERSTYRDIYFDLRKFIPYNTLVEELENILLWKMVKAFVPAKEALFERSKLLW